MTTFNKILATCAVIATVAIVSSAITLTWVGLSIKSTLNEKLDRLNPAVEKLPALVANSKELTANSKEMVGHLSAMAAPFSTSSSGDKIRDQDYVNDLDKFLREQLEGKDIKVLTYKEELIGTDMVQASEDDFDDWVAGVKREAGLWASRGSSTKDILWHVGYSMPPFRKQFMLKFPGDEEMIWVADWIREHHAPSADIVF